MAVADVVALEYADLLDPSSDLSSQIEEAFGLHGIGLLVVRNVPGFVERREATLPEAFRFGSLPEEVRAKYEVPSARYNIGWSHGKEKLESGRLDYGKGSYYFNPVTDTPSTDEELVRQQPENLAPNVWPSEDAPGFEEACKSLSSLIMDVGKLVARQCDRYVKSKLDTYVEGHLEQIIRTSVCQKARLLYYFPASTFSEQLNSEDPDSWCGWHNDHGSLTGLCSAMFFDSQGKQVDAPDPKGGLYAKNRAGEVVKVKIPKDCLAFQIGEAAQVHSGGILRATPHCVRAMTTPEAASVARATMAVFMEPDFDAVMDPPAGVDPKQVEVGAFQAGCTFGEFSLRTFDRYYNAVEGAEGSSSS